MDFRQLLQEERRRARESVAQKTRETCEDISTMGGNTSSAVDEPTSLSTFSATHNEPLSSWQSRNRIEIESFRVPGIKSVFCIPEWLSTEEEDAILSRVYDAPSSAWVQLRLRRLQMYGGEVKAPFRPEPLPLWLQQMADALVANGIFECDKAPNHALINEYGVGDGILSHEDGPSYFPLVAIVSTGADAYMQFSPHRKHADDPLLHDVRFIVRRRSLLLFTEEAYTKYLHSIDSVESGKRVSLTIRHVTITDTP